MKQLQTISLGSWRSATIALSLLLLATGRAESTEELETQVQQIFQNHCSECHYSGGDGNGEDPILNSKITLLSLRQVTVNGKRILVVGDPTESEIYLRVTRTDKGRMPKSSALSPKPPLSKQEQDLIRRWIVGPGNLPPREFVSEADVLRRIFADLNSLPSNERSDMRYLSLHNLWNLGRTNEPDSSFRIYRAAVSKLINSLSWQPKGLCKN